MGLIGEFGSLLPGEKQQSPETYLKGIDRSTLLTIGSSLLGFNPATTPFLDWRKFLGMWFRQENTDFAQKIANNCNRLEQRYQTSVSLYYNVAALRFFEFAFSLPDTGSTQSQVESEINLFKAYLLFLTRSTAQQITNADFLHNHKDHSPIALTLFNMQFPTADLENYDLEEIIVCQMVKGTALFQFMESNPSWVPLLQSFYAHFGISHWVEYLQRLLPLVRSIVNRTTEGYLEFKIPADANFDSSVHFLKILSLQNYTDAEIPDFIKLRENPLYQIDEATYRVISTLFVVEKIYKSLYFQLKALNENLPEPQKIVELRSAYGDNFTEQYLLYQVLDYIYQKRNYTRFTGLQLSKEFGVQGGPDYYIRNGNHLFLFENKDTFVPGNIKSSGDMEQILTDIKKKLYYVDKGKGKTKPKAVQQLAENIRRALLRENQFDKEYKARNIQIYPVLVLHDSSFNAPGLNQVINDWFSVELHKLNDQGINTERVKPITVINLDTLILYGEYIRRKKESLNDLIVTYHRSMQMTKKDFSSETEAQEYVGSKNISFGKFLEWHTKVGYKQLGMGLVGKAIKEIYNSQEKMTTKE
jgi:hypothetical protein